MYLVKSPWWLKVIYSKLVWQMPRDEKTIYLTFDDGPHTNATPFVLEILEQHKAKATFFCIGKNVVNQPEIFTKIIENGHAIGNHTHHHLNGWKTNDNGYLGDISQAKVNIGSTLFRPPYGRIKKSQINALIQQGFSIIMWSVLSGDFDKNLSKEKCLKNVLSNTTNGSIVVFHDSEKAFEKLHYCLPKVLAHFTQLGYQFKAL